MNWNRVIGGGIAAGIVLWLAGFVMHGVILGKTYERYTEVFTQTQANPLHFLAVSVALGIFAAVLFGKTRASWAEGAKGGMAFGLFLGLAHFFTTFYNPLVIEGFPYYLSWCWGGIALIERVLAGAVLGVVVKR